ncbi:hypothetical protein [Qipengyuania spongiae]|uniref:Entericidin A/B family lipoprotein n=1 Tax=Qipengyuania spongiae TaxID=2909673 RepID=A0ABY5T224_9SPHN|nr:hypothetical protein [Qipengyuania spongiae]UVI40838.1 hypothetical protein L1F33_08775 [Qipengyuania spongiae]
MISASLANAHVSFNQEIMRKDIGGGNRMGQNVFGNHQFEFQRGTNMRKFVMAIGLAAMTLSAAACNTVRGAGNDLESAANTVDDEI